MTSNLKAYDVRQLVNHEYRQWLLDKHYAKRLCSVSYAFGLINAEQGMANSSTFGVYVLRVRDRVLRREAVTLFLTLTVRPHGYAV